MPCAFVIDPADNTATLLEDAEGAVRLLGARRRVSLTLPKPVRLGHKVAVRRIVCGEPIVKFGVAIGTARAEIEPGEWIHLHNCASRFDERSGGFDLETGAAKDMRYG